MRDKQQLKPQSRMVTIGKRILQILIIIFIIISYFRGDTMWDFLDPNMGERSASFKMSGNVPPKTSSNFGGFYKGFPGDPSNIKESSDW